MRLPLDHTVSSRYRALFHSAFRWPEWEALIKENGLTIDRPRGSKHPKFSHIIYPLDYGYINETVSGDGEAVDVFIGEASTGLVGVLLTHAHRQEKRECKLLYNCAPPEVYLANGFINFDRSLLEAVLVLRWEMIVLWERAAAR